MIKLQRQIVEQLFAIMQRLGEKEAPRMFSYCLVKNKNKLEGEIKAIQSYKQDKVLLQYEEDRVKLCEKFSKALFGKVVQENGKFVGLDFNKDFTMALVELQNSSTYKEKLKDLKNFLEDKVDVDIYKIKFEHFPEFISPADMDILMILVDDSQPETQPDKKE